MTLYSNNESVADEQIGRAIRHAHLSGTTVPTDIARLIAMAIHGGPQTALYAFASSGQLDAVAVRDELSGDTALAAPLRWWNAIEAYVSAELLEEAA